MIKPQKEAGMKFALLIYPKLGSHEALGEDEYESVNAEYWALREDSAASVALTCSRSTRRPRFATAALRR